MRPPEWRKTHGGTAREWEGGVESPQGIDIPRVAELPRGDETPGVTTVGVGVLGEDGRGRVEGGTPPTT